MAETKTTNVPEAEPPDNTWSVPVIQHREKLSSGRIGSHLGEVYVEETRDTPLSHDDSEERGDYY